MGYALGIHSHQYQCENLAPPAACEHVFAIVAEWLAQPGVVLLQPGRSQAEILEKLVTRHRAISPMVTDAVLAALAIEHGATLASTDQDFGRFSDLRWLNPLAAS
jgi:predicted nucleic acid-binding protein